MSLKRPVAGGESCKQDSFLYKKVYCANCEKVINCGAVIGLCVSKSVQFKKIYKTEWKIAEKQIILLKNKRNLSDNMLKMHKKIGNKV